jgi:hypothetical protein
MYCSNGCKRLYLRVSSKYVEVKCGQMHGWIIYIMEDEKINPSKWLCMVQYPWHFFVNWYSALRNQYVFQYNGVYWLIS